MINTIKNLLDVCKQIKNTEATNDYSKFESNVMSLSKQNVGDVIKGDDIKTIQNTISKAVTDCICYSDC
jgi:hypothetical protein